MDLLRGSQRRMIKIAGCTDTIFEEAYFILKPNFDSQTMSERDIIVEANRIIRESTVFSDKSNKRFVKVSMSSFMMLLITSVMGILGTIISVIVLF